MRTPEEIAREIVKKNTDHLDGGGHAIMFEIEEAIAAAIRAERERVRPILWATHPLGLKVLNWSEGINTGNPSVYERLETGQSLAIVESQG